jgi:hypothetical protein
LQDWVQYKLNNFPPQKSLFLRWLYLRPPVD